MLVVIYTAALDVLLLERAANPGYWQSVTGSCEPGEAPFATAQREVTEETGLAPEAGEWRDWQMSNTFEIFAEWRHRYAPGITHNLEHVFSLCLPQRLPIRLAPGEHRDQCWLPWQAAAERCFSWTNRDAILLLPRSTGKMADFSG